MAEQELTHHGVMGMKWGVRRYQPYPKGKTGRYTGDGDLGGTSKGAPQQIIRKGKTIQNISSNTPRSTNHMVYGSFEKQDNKRYAGDYALEVMARDPHTSVFKNQFEVTKPIVIPSEKKAYDVFKEVYNKQPQALLAALSVTKVEKATLKRLATIADMPIIDKEFEKYVKLGETRVKDAVFQDFFTHIPMTRMDKYRNEYFEKLVEEGFSGVVDYNDKREGGNINNPILIFKGDDHLNLKKSTEITLDDIKRTIAKMG